MGGLVGGRRPLRWRTRRRGAFITMVYGLGWAGFTGCRLATTTKEENGATAETIGVVLALGQMQGHVAPCFKRLENRLTIQVKDATRTRTVRPANTW